MDNFNKIMILAIVFLSSTVAWEGYLVMAGPAPGRSSVVTPGGQTTPCTYDNYQDTGKFLGKDCKTGDNKFSEATAGALWTDELASNVAEFWEAGTWDWCGSGGITPQIIGQQGMTIWGVYNQTIFKCSLNNGDALIIGNQNVNTNALTAFDIYVHDITFDGGWPGTGTTGVALGIANAFDVHVDHCMFQNAGNIAGGTVQMAIYNSNQGGSLDTWITNSVFYRQNLSVEGVRNGGVTNSFFYGTAPGITNQQLVDYSIGDIFPLSVERLEDFHFDYNHVIGWTGTVMEGFQSVSNSTINYNYFGPDSSGNTFQAIIKTVNVVGPRLNGLTIQGNTFDKGTGVVQFRYGTGITIKDNIWTQDSTPGGLSIALQLSPGTGNGVYTISNVTVTGNTFNAWGGGGIDANFTRGSITGNTMYSLNQGAGNTNGNPGIMIENGLKNVAITNNQIYSVSSSGAGIFRPIYYAGAGTNILIENNVLQNVADGSNAQGIVFGVSKDATVTVRYNKYYVTESQGSASVLANTLTVVVNHGLASNPTSVIFTSGNSTYVGTLRATSFSSTQFTISSSVSGAGTVYWEAVYWP